MDTEVLTVKDIIEDEDKLVQAAELIKSGQLVAIPTETVYGLGANALDINAVNQIFKVKGRPQDNPLIIHIADASELSKYCEDVPQAALLLAERFWPGPLTMILKRNSIIPDAVTAGLDTVAVRCPDHPAALRIIKLSGVPIAAPSANISGSPSPTEPEHVIADLSGKIPAIIDGGSCGVGLESTIIDLSVISPRILRPGGITPEQIVSVIGKIELDATLLRAPIRDEKPKAPGMKYRHYAPRAKVIIVKGDIGKAAAYVNENSDKNTAVLCFDGEEGYFKTDIVLAYGGKDDFKAQANKLFTSLRALDKTGVDTIFARCPESKDVGLAVANRLMKAAGYNVIEVGA